MTAVLKKFVVTIDGRGSRLDRFLTKSLIDVSRTRLKSLIEEGFVKINEKGCKEPAFKVREGDHVEVIIPPAEEAIPFPEDIPLDILYEDQDLIVINKPPGLVVHPAPGNSQGTLVNALLSHCKDSLSGIGGVKRPGIVHRLDKGTSGLLVVAKNDKAHLALSQQLVTRQMKRLYHALVWGFGLPQEGSIEGAIGRDPRHRQRMAMMEKGKFARTHYQVLRSFKRMASLLECRLDTGRTHQIRVHLMAKGHPVIGDALYGKQPKGTPDFLKTYLKESWPQGRHALHAKELSFIHPTSEKELSFTTDIPEDMRKLIDVLNSFT